MMTPANNQNTTAAEVIETYFTGGGSPKARYDLWRQLEQEEKE